MAVLLGNKIVKDTESFNDYAIGISLPIQIGNTAFNQTFQTVEQVKSNIKNLLLTKKGERVMQPEFGSGLQEALFEMNDNDLEERLEDIINNAIETWLPYVTVDSVDIQASNESKDRNKVNVSIKYKYSNNINLNEVTFTVQG
jgi:uncharacterized protein